MQETKYCTNYQRINASKFSSTAINKIKVYYDTGPFDEKYYIELFLIQ